MNENRLEALAQCARAVDETIDRLQNIETRSRTWQYEDVRAVLEHLEEVREQLFVVAPRALVEEWQDYEAQIRAYEEGDQTMNSDQYEQTRDARDGAFERIIAELWRS